MAEISTRPLELNTEMVHGTIVVHVSGSLGIVEANKLRLHLGKLADAENSMIILELSEMNFICSMGLGAIISAHLKQRPKNGLIRLVAPQPPVAQLFEMTHLTKLFEIFPSVAEATER